ncbi:MAG: hypothetical protein JWS10_1998 [Cypionkella sp.]|nr:hypothetical protein [Cypionkella sp.]
MILAFRVVAAFAGGKQGCDEGKGIEEIWRGVAVTARAMLGEGAGHQAAIAPSRMRAAEAFGVAVRGVGLIEQDGD